MEMERERERDRVDELTSQQNNKKKIQSSRHQKSWREETCRSFCVVNDLQRTAFFPSNIRLLSPSQMRCRSLHLTQLIRATPTILRLLIRPIYRWIRIVWGFKCRRMAQALIPELIDSQRVLYKCTCGLLKTIHRIYFCRYCNEIRCRDCVCHEVFTFTL